ncbi:nickel pincer cofactor biosynthesis protein LarC [Ruminiclostridium herbifermentans]|uniref:Pyridinium-3,5-bisthiocarboxylic acid mononucleotide nickel insertion protein n=1 Tax=Ruminiclostridium herbifermentans TaxID=2488810 RepID=A0A4U7J907_9FIRM|nr:nickel pincer cofactor biosynthesis protein LarC [Ruminiclostridium herbifermentans]QNU65910.1 nickel pincer cofactor biosynthesis protein LarC [Ruminiclostridium herbifermentans]
MRVLYFDCFSGISGDMTLGALLDLGLEQDVFLNELKKLNLTGYSIEIRKVVKNGISGTDVVVILDDEESGHMHCHENEDHKAIEFIDYEKVYENQFINNNENSNGCHHEKTHSHSHIEKCSGQTHSHSHHSHSQPERNLADIENIINMSDLKPRVKAMSTKIFRELARAEAKVHGKGINEIHFHEVGAVDSIVDIIGACICIDMLGVERIYASELHDGKGFVKCAHGLMPVPVPAVMEMLCESNIPLVTEDVPCEMVTPTGMAILKVTCSSFGKMPPLSIERTGYGMGKRDTGRFNALRAVVGTLYEHDSIPNDEISILETNIDNMSPEILGYTMEKLFDSGALDVYYTPIYMKKSRPSVVLTVLAKCGDEKKFTDIIFKETSTLGVRISHSQRYCMNRELVKVDTQYGAVRVKVASSDDIMKFAPEYEDCKNIAMKTGMPINKVYELVSEKYKREGNCVAIQ